MIKYDIMMRPAKNNENTFSTFGKTLIEGKQFGECIISKIGYMTMIAT